MKSDCVTSGLCYAIFNFILVVNYGTVGDSDARVVEAMICPVVASSPTATGILSAAISSHCHGAHSPSPEIKAMLTLRCVSHSPKEHPGLLIYFSTLNVTHDQSLFSQGSESSSNLKSVFLTMILSFFSAKWYMT